MLGMSLVDLFLGSPTMVVLLICSVVTVGYAVERALYFMKSKSDTQGFMKQLSVKLKAGDLKAATQWCDAQKGAAARVISQCLPYLHINSGDLNQRFNTAIEMEQVEMERNLSVLGTMSNIAPLLGLFGTVIGIIRAFADIARTGAGGSAVVAMGVSEALLTTAAGIVVAVIATVCFNLYVRRIRTRVIELEDVREEFFNLIRQAAAAGRKSKQGPAQDHSADTIYSAAQDATREPAHVGQ
jgi:biopolymer transport protein ExbB